MATVVVSQHILIDYYCNNVLLNEERLVRWVIQMLTICKIIGSYYIQDTPPHVRYYEHDNS